MDCTTWELVSGVESALIGVDVESMVRNECKENRAGLVRGSRGEGLTVGLSPLCLWVTDVNGEEIKGEETLDKEKESGGS